MTIRDHRQVGPDSIPASDRSPVHAPPEDQAALMRHIEKYIGKPTSVCHEIVSEYVHVDVHVIPPNDKHNFTTLVTTGMSDRPMTPPAERAEFRFAELLLVLPPEWPVTGALADQWPWRWPADWLQGLARLPHRYKSWSFLYHSFSNGEPPKPYGDGINFVGGFLGFAASFHPDISKVEIAPGKTVYFFAAIPLYAEELTFKQQNGGEALARKLWAAGVHDRLDLRRKSVV